MSYRSIAAGLEGRCEAERLESRVLLATTLVQDLEPMPGRADATPGVTLDGVAYFAATGPRGRELYRSDGTDDGTHLLRDLLPGAPSSNPSGLLRFRDAIYFTAANRAGGRDLWTTDGTRDGTRRVRGFKSAISGRLLRTRDALYFSVADAAGEQTSVWKSDGSRKGTLPVVRHDEGTGMTVVPDSPLARAGGNLFFLARSGGDNEPELWAWDGSQPQRLREFPTPRFLVPPYEFESFRGELYFIAYDTSRSRVAWRSDGTADGTHPLNPTVNAGDIHSIARVNRTKLLLAGDDASFLTDGSNAGTKRLERFSHVYSCCTRPDDAVFFTAGAPGWRNLWRTDGSVKGTFALGTIGETHMVKLRGVRHFLRPHMDDTGASLWRTDGTPQGTWKVRSFPRSQARWFAGVAGGKILFSTHRAYDRKGPDRLWVSDGTKAGTRPLKRLHEGTIGTDPQHTTVVGNDVYFSKTFGRIDDFGTPYPLFRLYRRDGETGKIVKVFTTSGTLQEIVHANDKLYVRSSQEPWCCVPGRIIETLRTINTTTGDVRRVFIGPSKSPQHRLMPFGDGLVLLPWRDEDSAVELGLLDASGAGTVLKDINPDGSSFPAGFVRLGDNILFAATDAESGRELWLTDGTAPGTQRLHDVSPSAASSDPTDITVLGDVAFFVASDESHGRALWRTDGSEAGTVLVKDLRDDLDDPQIGSLTVLDDRLFFVADDGEHGPELWTSDGSPQGTRLVKDIYPGMHGAAPSSLTVFGDALYFAAGDGTHGRELWRTDGTAEGTTLVADFMPGRRGSSPSSLFASSGRIFFAAEDARYGVELWASDGSPSGPRRLTDLFPGRASSNPMDFAEADGRLFFSADDGRHGRELWQFRP